jgi:hypothetical protein
MALESDGDQVLDLFKRQPEKVLHEIATNQLTADMHLAGHQHLAFHRDEYKDPRGNRLFVGHFNGSVYFQ